MWFKYFYCTVLFKFKNLPILTRLFLILNKIFWKNLLWNGARHTNERNAKLFVMLPLFEQLHDWQISLEATDNEQTIYFIFGEALRNLVETDFFGVNTLTSEQRATDASPAVDALPAQLLDIAIDKSLEAVLHTQYLTTLPNTVTYKWTHCWVDSTSGRTHIHHRKRVSILFFITGWLGLHLFDILISLKYSFIYRKSTQNSLYWVANKCLGFV